MNLAGGFIAMLASGRAGARSSAINLDGSKRRETNL
jgi:hypothetical protein